MLLLTGCTGNTESAADDIKDQTSVTGLTTTATTEEEIEIVPERIYPDNTYKALDPAYRNTEIAERGTVVRFTYDTKDNVGGDNTVYQNLPTGYDENDTETRYNVMYFMQGGSDSPEGS